mmetsp:Transcript_4186/g.17689  ORF Transcript_4186/g.17689 Transcript_4186/m.17689 type:complete len:384 (-) Transcript_4186:159-1310(-)
MPLLRRSNTARRVLGTSGACGDSRPPLRGAARRALPALGPAAGRRGSVGRPCGAALRTRARQEAAPSQAEAGAAGRASHKATTMRATAASPSPLLPSLSCRKLALASSRPPRRVMASHVRWPACPTPFLLRSRPRRTLLLAAALSTAATPASPSELPLRSSQRKPQSPRSTAACGRVACSDTGFRAPATEATADCSASAVIWTSEGHVAGSRPPVASPSSAMAAASSELAAAVRRRASGSSEPSSTAHSRDSTSQPLLSTGSTACAGMRTPAMWRLTKSARECRGPSISHPSTSSESSPAAAEPPAAAAKGTSSALSSPTNSSNDTEYWRSSGARGGALGAPLSPSEAVRRLCGGPGDSRANGSPWPNSTGDGAQRPEVAADT